MTKKISLILPVYNEQENIEHVVRDICRYFASSNNTCEIIIVNDGSTDKTGEILNRLVDEFDYICLIKHEKNRGYGMALISGFKHAKNNIVGFMDSDGQFDIQDIGKLLSYSEDFDVVVGRRKERNDPWERVLLGKIYSLIIRTMFGVSIRDINCGFKIFRKSVLNTMELGKAGALIDAELLVKMHRAGCSMHEIDVTHFSRNRGKQTGAQMHVITRAIHELWCLFLEMRQDSDHRKKENSI